MRRWILAFALAPMLAQAAERAPAQIERAIRTNIPDLPITAVYRTPVPGLFEVVAGDTIYYADASGQHLIAGGHLFETRTHRDLTRERLEEIRRVDFSALPLDLALASGPADAKTKIAIFTDPDCPFCRNLEQLLTKLDDVRIYRFLYPLEQLHPNARRHAEAIWCAKDRDAALRAVMLEGKDLSPPAGCRTPIDRVVALGRRLGVMGTPTLIAADGRMHPGGFRSLAELRRWLARR